MAVEMQSVDILDCYSALEDPRQRTKVIYPLPEILLLVLCGVMAGADDFSEITRWGKLHVEFLRRFLPYREGIPSHDTVNAVIAALDGEAFRDAFVSWVAGLRAADQDGEVIAIDGKTSRSSPSTARRRGARARRPPGSSPCTWSRPGPASNGWCSARRRSGAATTRSSPSTACCNGWRLSLIHI